MVFDEKEELGDLQVKEKSWELAAKSYVEAIAKNPREPRLYHKLGDLQRYCGDLIGASKSYGRAAELRQHKEGSNNSNSSPTAAHTDNTTAYLELLKNCLTYQLWDASDGNVVEFRRSKPVVSFARFIQLTRQLFKPPSTNQREFGLDWPAKALTMVGKARLDNIQFCVEKVIQDGIPGDLIETGVWRGGCTIFMRALLKSFGDLHRNVWVADSFFGMPKPNIELYPADKKYDLSMWRTLAVSSQEVRENFARFNLLDERVKFLEGWFSQTLPKAPIKELSLMRLDGDLYESTMDALKNLYPKLSPGGFVIIDDYYCAPPCKQAVDKFREENNIEDEIIAIDWSGVFWCKNDNQSK